MILQATLYHYISSMIHKTHKKKTMESGAVLPPGEPGHMPEFNRYFLCTTTKNL